MSFDNITNMQNMTAYITANQKNINTLFEIVNQFLPEYDNIKPAKPFVDDIPMGIVVSPDNSKPQATATIFYPPDKESPFNDKIDDNNPITKFLNENPNIDPLSNVYPEQQLKTERPNTTRKSKGNGKSKRNKNSGKRKYTRKKGKKSIVKRRPPWRG